MFGRWFKKKKYFEGYDITGYEYLGYSNINFHDHGKPDVIVQKATVYCFCKADDHSDRMCLLSEANFNFTNHQWMREFASHWRLGSYNLEAIVHTMPSQFLMEYMLDNKNMVWHAPTYKWYDVNDAMKMSKPIPNPIIEKKEDNVVQLSFPDRKVTLDNPATIE